MSHANLQTPSINYSHNRPLSCLPNQGWLKGCRACWKLSAEASGTAVTLKDKLASAKTSAGVNSNKKLKFTIKLMHSNHLILTTVASMLPLRLEDITIKINNIS